MVNEVHGIGGNFVPRDIRPVGAVSGGRKSSGPAGGDEDLVEISELARLMGKISRLPDIRQDKVATVRAAIESGTYETSEKWDTVVGQLVEEL